MGRSRTFQILLALASLAFVACNDKFMAQSARSKTSAFAAISTTVDEAGNISGTIDPSASATQLLKFSSGELAGSAIAIPPGALSIPVSVTVGAGESLSSSQFLQDVGITNNSISAAGPSVAFTPSQPVEATNPLTLSIPFSSGSSLSLTTSNDNIVVLYRWTKVVNGESSHSMGIIPAKDVVIAKDKVSFQTTKFGVFQLGKAETKIVERVNVQSVQPPAPKRDVSNPLVGTWGACESGVNRDEFQEPVFLNPEWTNISVNQFGVRFGIRGKVQPLKISSSIKEDCSDDRWDQIATSVKGFLAKSHLADTPLYYTLRDAAGNVSKSCQAVYPVQSLADDHTQFTRYNAGDSWVHLEWTTAEAVDLLQHNGLDCSGAGTNVSIDKLGDGSQARRATVNNLKPSAKYSFSLKTVAGHPVCQNVMTAGADAPDWAYGNDMEWFESTGGAPEFDSQVTDGKDYKLRVSINGLIPVETYSQVIPKSGQSALVKIPAAEAQGQIITLWTPKGCSFIGSDGDRSPALPLPLRPGENMPIVLCDGATDGEHGGGDFFGANPRSPMISKAVNLKITNGAFTMIEDLFESINCAADTRISSTVQNGGIGLPAKDFLKDTHPIDVTIKSRVGVMFTDAGVTAANRISPEKYGCGLKGWVKGQRMDLKDSSCGGDMGQTKYERIKIIGDRLYFCEIQGEKDSYGKTPEMRIPSCDINGQSFFLKRQ